jgi:NADH-ubiquinone oxidoreductase chain 1
MILIILLSVAFLVLLERKLLRGVQLRTRPVNVRYWGVMQTVVDRLKLLNKPSAMNNIYSFNFLAVIILIGFVTNYYMMVVIILALMLLLLNRIVMSNNIYSKMGGYRLIVLAWRYDIVLLVMLLVIPKTLVILSVMYFVFSCEVGRTPIDLIEGESELVSRFNTEFSRGEFVRFFLREYLGIVIFLVIVVSLDTYMMLILYGLVMWVRRSYPRKKYTEVVLSI